MLQHYMKCQGAFKISHKYHKVCQIRWVITLLHWASLCFIFNGASLIGQQLAKNQHNYAKAERIEWIWDSIEPSSPSLCPPSGSHQHLTQEGAAAPCWGAGEWILFCPGASETTIPQCAMLYWTPLWCGVVRCEPPYPKLDVRWRRPGTRRSHPSTGEHRATSHSWRLCLPRSAGNGKKEGARRELFSLEAA